MYFEEDEIVELSDNPFLSRLARWLGQEPRIQRRWIAEMQEMKRSIMTDDTLPVDVRLLKIEELNERIKLMSDALTRFKAYRDELKQGIDRARDNAEQRYQDGYEAGQRDEYGDDVESA